MSNYELSRQAEKDLEDVFDYTALEFGLDQAKTYLLSLESIINTLAQNPKIGRERLEIKRGLRSLLKGNHIVFYRIVNTKVRIVRVLHGSRDLPQQF